MIPLLLFMKIYTKTGDEGKTSLFGGQRVSKSNLRIEAYGTVDELNSHIGLLRDQEVNAAAVELLIEIQNNLFSIGANLAADPTKNGLSFPKVSEIDISKLEEAIDSMDAVLAPLKNFILPGGHIAVSFGHVARTVCRRAERRVISLSETEQVDPLIVMYLNRLSDYLFMLCRKMASDLGVMERPWNASKN